MNIPIDLNRRWISGLHQGMNRLEDGTKLEIMKPAASHCVVDILSLCEKYLGKEIDSVDDLLSGWNMLRKDRGLNGNWVYEGTLIRGIFSECGCPLVRSGLIELDSVQCFCSQNMMENIFSRTAKRGVNVKIERSIGRGDSVCEFVITYL